MPLNPLNATCVLNNSNGSAACPSTSAPVQCEDTTDCVAASAGTPYCCGIVDTIPPGISATCKSTSQLTAGGQCKPYPATAFQTAAQLCNTANAGECQNGLACLPQTCTVDTVTVHLTMCGLQTFQGTSCTNP